MSQRAAWPAVRPGAVTLRTDAWADRSACREPGVDLDAFYVDGKIKVPARAWEAIAVCDRCPVWLECLRAGLHEPDAIWGGLTPSQRGRVRRWLAQRPDGASLAELAATVRARALVRRTTVDGAT